MAASGRILDYPRATEVGHRTSEKTHALDEHIDSTDRPLKNVFEPVNAKRMVEDGSQNGKALVWEQDTPGIELAARRGEQACPILACDHLGV